MALRRLSFTSSAASNWKPPPPLPALSPRTSGSWGLNRRSGEAGSPTPSAPRSPAHQTATRVRGSPGQGK